jgi:hypothetical protein
VAARYLTGARSSLAVGLDSLAAAHHLPVTHMLAHNEHLRARMGERFPGRTILRLLGLHTLLPDKSFEVALATDFIRSLPQEMIQAMAKELCRIAGQALLLCHPALESLISEDGLPFVSFQNLVSILEAAGLRLEERLARDSSALYALLPSSAS